MPRTQNKGAGPAIGGARRHDADGYLLEQEIMGLIRRLFSSESGPTPSQVRKGLKQVTQMHGEAGTRVAAMERLASWRTPEAARALLRRFTVQTPQASMDLEEKQYAVKLLAGMGEPAVEPILQYLRTEPDVTHPVRALEELLPPGEFLGALLGILSGMADEYTRWPEAKAVLIGHLSDEAFSRVADTVLCFVDDDDDDVSIAAIDYLARNGDEAIREKLLESFLAAEHRPRVRGRILDHFCELGWPVRGYRKRMEEAISLPYYLTAKGIVKRRTGPEA